MNYKPFQSLSIEIKMGLLILAALVAIAIMTTALYDGHKACVYRVHRWTSHYIRHPDYEFSCNEEYQCNLLNKRNSKMYHLDCSGSQCYIREQERN